MQYVSLAAKAFTTYETVMSSRNHKDVATLSKAANHPKLMMGTPILAAAPAEDFLQPFDTDLGNDDSAEFDPYAATLKLLSADLEFAHATWTGLYSGLYGMQKKH